MKLRFLRRLLDMLLPLEIHVDQPALQDSIVAINTKTSNSNLMSGKGRNEAGFILG
eukprot:m.135937 g.135937  ORF g.135937 m.135937 type:complete len:56 (-) comp23931_c0_seq1:327-494(-)